MLARWAISAPAFTAATAAAALASALPDLFTAAPALLLYSYNELRGFQHIIGIGIKGYKLFAEMICELKLRNLTIKICIEGDEAWQSVCGTKDAL